ncbi:MAG: hypothetical protein WAS51_07865 [Ilumatobacteraceae bacterium]
MPSPPDRLLTTLSCDRIRSADVVATDDEPTRVRADPAVDVSEAVEAAHRR